MNAQHPHALILSCRVSTHLLCFLQLLLVSSGTQKSTWTSRSTTAGLGSKVFRYDCSVETTGWTLLLWFVIQVHTKWLWFLSPAVLTHLLVIYQLGWVAENEKLIFIHQSKRCRPVLYPPAILMDFPICLRSVLTFKLVIKHNPCALWPQSVLLHLQTFAETVYIY